MTDHSNSTSATLLGRLHDESDPTAWQEFHDLYAPWMKGWLRSHRLSAQDADDVTQEVMKVVLQQVSSFEHNARLGAFRNWLKKILKQQLAKMYRRNQKQPLGQGGSVGLEMAAQLEDPQSRLSQIWEREHQQVILYRLFKMVEPMHSVQTVSAFRAVVLEEKSPAKVAGELKTTPNAVYLACSHVLKSLREAGAGLVD